MKTKVQFIKDIDKDIKYLEEAAEIIKNGGIGAFPTETVYGLKRFLWQREDRRIIL